MDRFPDRSRSRFFSDTSDLSSFSGNDSIYLLTMSKMRLSPPPPSSSSPPPVVSVAIESILLQYMSLESRWNAISALECIPNISGGSWSGRDLIYVLHDSTMLSSS